MMFRKSFKKNQKAASQYLSKCNQKLSFNNFKTQIDVHLYLSCYIADPLQYDSMTSLRKVREGPALLFLKSTVLLLMTSVTVEVSLIFSK